MMGFGTVISAIRDAVPSASSDGVIRQRIEHKVVCLDS
jgi:hypothetical protein